MGEAKTYEGSCHCGKVKYKATTDLAMVIECNCSLCSRRGHILTFVSPDQFESVSGDDHLTDYQFNQRAIHHVFCKTCGINSYARGKKPDGTEMVAINLRCLEGLDLTTLTPTKVDGKSR